MFILFNHTKTKIMRENMINMGTNISINKLLQVINVQNTFIPNISDVYLICLGEIFNYDELANMIQYTFQTDTTGEIIIPLYKKYGIEQTLQMLDGEFIFILYDCNLHNENKTEKETCIIARDATGIRNISKINLENNVFGFSTDNNEQEFPICPGAYSVYEISFKILSVWKATAENIKYYVYPFTIINETEYKVKNKNILLKYLETYIIDFGLQNMNDSDINIFLNDFLQNAIIKIIIDKQRKLKNKRISFYDKHKQNICVIKTVGYTELFNLNSTTKDLIQFDKETRELLKNVCVNHNKDTVLSCPWLDKEIVEFVLSLPLTQRYLLKQSIN
jgi:hypothetical protein